MTRQIRGLFERTCDLLVEFFEQYNPLDAGAFAEALTGNNSVRVVVVKTKLKGKIQVGSGLIYQ